MVDHSILLNIKQHGPVESGIAVTQGDHGKTRLAMRVKDGDAYITDADKASLSFKLSNGYVVTGEAQLLEGAYIYVFRGNELQAPGKVSAVLTLRYEDGRVSSCGFTFVCRYHPLYGKIFDAGSYIPDLEKIIAEAQGQVDYLRKLIEELQKQADVHNVLTRNDLVNDSSTTEAGMKALDAAMGKTLTEKDKELERTIKELVDSGGTVPENVLTTEDLINDLDMEVDAGKKAVDAALLPQIKQAIENGGEGGIIPSGGYVFVEPEASEEGIPPVPEPMLDADALGGQPASHYAPQSQITDAFSEDKAYTVGQYCIYLNRLYKFSEAKAEGPWDESKVEACTVLGEIGALNLSLEKQTWYYIKDILGDSFLSDIENKFASTGNYSIFQQSSLYGSEGGWFMFKHDINIPASGILCSRSNLYHIKRNSNGEWVARIL